MSDPTVLAEKREGYCVLTLNRPDRLNAISLSLLEDMNAALDEVARDESCRALLITGAGRAFCSGQDLTERAVQPEQIAAMVG